MQVEDIKVNTVVKVNPIPKILGQDWNSIKIPVRGIVKAVASVSSWDDEDKGESIVITVEIKDMDGNIVEGYVSPEEISPYLENPYLGIATLLATKFKVTPSQFELLKDRFVTFVENEQGDVEEFYSFDGKEYFEVIVEEPASDKYKGYEQLIEDTIAQEELRKEAIIVQIDNLGASTYSYVVYHGVMPLIRSREPYFSYTDALKAGVAWGKDFLGKLDDFEATIKILN